MSNLIKKLVKIAKNLRNSKKILKVISEQFVALSLFFSILVRN